MDSQDYNNSTEDDDDESQQQQQQHCDDDDDDDDDWLLPSCARKTAKGGYAHTWNKSSSDFSGGAANQGNAPWNKRKRIEAKGGGAVKAKMNCRRGSGEEPKGQGKGCCV
jgi:hypothetical protein